MSSSSSSAPGKQCPELKDVATALKMPVDMSSSECCKWGGIRCNSDGYVTYIDWSREGASGTIPDSIQKLTSLEVLDLYDNKLTGSIPNTLGQLTKLTGLLNGSIPNTLGQLTNLKVLAFHDNQLTGSIPPALGQLTNLIQLDLRNNRLDGKIPESLGSLKNLDYLSLENNQLTGPIPALAARFTCTLFRQQALSSLCYAGDTRTGECYDQITSNGIKDCPPAALSAGSSSMVPIFAGVGALFVAIAVAIGVLMYRLRQSKAAAATPAAPEKPGPVLPSTSVTVDMGIAGNRGMAAAAGAGSDATATEMPARAPK
ncbi:hypothetical protein BC828DRAFT_440215 [Blastocladiella britannica]|nr:hypothetical protein BC828DRAFT_440215 [Blastocladiella britannica]